MNNMTMGQGERVNQAMARAAVEESIERDRRKARVASMYGLGVVAALVLAGALALMAVALSGCAMLGANAKAPGRFEEALFTVTNVPMVTTAWTTNVVRVTNTVEQAVQVVQTNFVTVTNTAAAGSLGTASPTFQVVPVYVTNTFTVQTPVVSLQTNAIAPGTTVQVPQLTGPSTATQTGTTLIGGIAGMFGWGGVATTVLGGLLTGWMRNRNLALQASYTGASQAATVAEQAGATLVQQVETMLEFLKQTPQGAQYVPAIKQFLQNHQLETGTVVTIANWIKENVDNEAARNASGDILESVNDLRGLLASVAARPANVTAAGPATATVPAPRVGV